MASMRRTRSFRTISRRNRVLRALMLGATALSLFGASEASAQFYGYVGTYRGPVYEDDMAPMPPRAVVYRLQDRGFSEISRPRFDGRAYIVDATNPAGHRVRLYVDAGDGSIFGRQRLDAPPARVARAAPGYGWTDDEPVARRGRDPEAILPPADIPLPRPSLHTEIERAPKVASRPGAADPNTFGVNPDARPGAKPDARKAEKAAPRKTAKLTPPAKPAAPRLAPEAPVPTAAPAEPSAPNAAATPEPAKVPEVAKAPDAVTAPAEPPKADTVPLLPAAKLPVNEEKAAEKPAEPAPADKPAESAAPAQAAQKPAEAPATPQVADKPAAEKPAEQASTDKPAETKPTAAAEAPKPETKEAANQKWQDPPSGDAKRKVRIIGGTSTVPGASPAPSGETAPPAAN